MSDHSLNTLLVYEPEAFPTGGMTTFFDDLLDAHRYQPDPSMSPIYMHRQGRETESSDTKLSGPLTGVHINDEKKYINHEYVTQTYVTITNTSLIKLLQEIVNWQPLYNTTPKIPMHVVLSNLQTFKKENSEKHNEILSAFIDLIETYNRDKLLIIRSMINKGKISFDSLWYLFSGNKTIVFKHLDEQCAGTIVNTDYTPTTFVIYFTSYMKSGNGYEQITLSNHVSIFKDTVDISSLSIQLLTPEMKARLTKRGDTFLDLVNNDKATHLAYEGFLHATVRNDFSLIGTTDTKMYINGKVMVDTEGYDMYGFSPNAMHIKNAKSLVCCMQTIKKNSWSLFPFVYGYGLSHGKEWGLLAIGKLSKIVYRNDVYSELYLPEINGTDKKSLILNFIKNKDNFIKDTISGKGEGIIFLLHGPSGVGKTLTAEVTAEQLQLPLIHINTSDILYTGDTKKGYDTVMKNILLLSERWNAIILIDEADIFVERRSLSDIKRNAIVGTFLKVLEYFNGVMFLTTNRSSCFDEAILNRVHVTFKYENLSEEGRLQIWKNLVCKILKERKKNPKPFLNIGKITFKEVAKLELNGRQIRTCLNLALCYAEHSKIMLNTECITNTAKMNFLC